LHQLMHAEAFAHPQSSFAAPPLATCAVSQRPGVVLAITNRLHEIAQRTTRTGDDDEFTVGSHRTFAVDPDPHPLPLSHPMGEGGRKVGRGSDAVMATIPKAFGFR